MSGAFDYLLKVVVEDLPEWTRIGEQLTAKEAGADRINTHVLLRKPKPDSAARNSKRLPRATWAFQDRLDDARQRWHRSALPGR